MLGALSSFLRGGNFEGKREFIKVRGGLEFLSGLIENETEEAINKKAIFLIYDLLLNDDGIFESDKEHVRKVYGTEINIVPRLLSLLKESSQVLVDENIPQQWDIREYILRCIFRINQVCAEQLAASQDDLKAHA